MSEVTDRVRRLLGEEVPVDGSDADTMFSNAAIDALILNNPTTDAAVAEGWRVKAAQFADLVDTQEGTSKRAMSDLHENALRMASVYGGEGIGTVSGNRTRQHKLTRS